ncbi:hypothetical protein ACVWZA_001973 [Sphingomonas sp. UYAg733]
MKKPAADRWLPLTADGEIIWLKYDFGPGTCNAVGVKLRDGSWAVISPPRNPSEEVFGFFMTRGGVSALIAPNAFHNMGQAEWRARFTTASSYAPAGAMTRLAKKTPGISYLPLEELTARFAPARWLLPDGMKAPDILFHMPANGADIWWLGDQFSNMAPDDQILPLRLLATLFFGSGLGFRANAKPELVYVADRTAWLDSIAASLAEAPPTIVVPAHGDPVIIDAAARTIAAANAIDPRRPKAGD